MVYKVPSRPFPEHIISMLTRPPDPRAFYRKRVGNHILEPLISIENQALLRKAAIIAGINPEDVNLPPVKPKKPEIRTLGGDLKSEVMEYIR